MSARSLSPEKAGCFYEVGGPDVFPLSWQTENMPEPSALTRGEAACVMVVEERRSFDCDDPRSSADELPPISRAIDEALLAQPFRGDVYYRSSIERATDELRQSNGAPESDNSPSTPSDGVASQAGSKARKPYDSVVWVFRHNEVDIHQRCEDIKNLGISLIVVVPYSRWTAPARQTLVETGAAAVLNSESLDPKHVARSIRLGVLMAQEGLRSGSQVEVGE